MKNVLNGNVRIWHLLGFALILLLFSGGAVALAAPDVISAYFPAGDIRLASAWKNDPITVSGTDQPPVKVLSVSFTVPDGKKAELQTTFSGELQHGTGGAGYAWCDAYFGLDSASPDPAFKPGGFIIGDPSNSAYQLLGGPQAKEPQIITSGMAGFRKNVPAGKHTVNVYFVSVYSGCTVFARNLNVIVNIH